jgi:hypothetical protein
VLFFITFLVHAPALGFGFSLYDDTHQILQNPTLEWSAAPSYFVKDVWRNPAPQYRNYYRPIFMLWLLLNFKLFGLHPAAWHLAALALHGVVVVMVYRLGLRLMGSELVAASSAILFAVHPTHVESVVWLSGITEPLTAVFFLCAFLQYLRWRETHGTRPALLCALLTLLALLSKETAAALPLLIALYEWLFPSAASEGLRARMANSIRGAAPAFGATLVYACMRWRAMQHLVIVNNNTLHVLMSWPLLLLDYTRMMLWPLRLALFYDVGIVNHASAMQLWLPLLFAMGCAALLCLAFARNKLAAFLACWWLLPIAPALVGLFSFPAVDIMHDRYTYLSSVSFALLLAWGVSRLPRRGGQAFGLPAEPVVAVLILVCGWGVLTAQQTQVWRNGLTLYGNAVAVSPNNVRARNLLANQLTKAGHLRQALSLYDDTLKLDPNAWETNFALAVTLASNGGELPRAELLLRHACQVSPKNPESYLALAELLRAESRPGEAHEVLRAGLSNVGSGADELQQKMAEIK